MFLLPERAQPASQVHELPVESRQLSVELVTMCLESASELQAGTSGSVHTSRIQLAPHARRRAVLKTSEWVPVIRLTSDEERTYRDNDCIYSEYALSEENPMDCIMHYLLGDHIIS